jgi:phosphoglycolate phosphatase-like HAD superfamily hydrolase
MKLVCFDIDGTLIWTNGAGRRAIHRALLEELGTAGPIETFRFDGRTDGEIISKLAEAAGLAVDRPLVDRVLERYVANLRDELGRPGHHTTVYPGVRELLDALEARGDCVVGLLTGNVASGARLKLGSAGLEFARFRIGAFGSDSIERTELPEIAQRRAREALGLDVPGGDVVVIGDTPADVRCGLGIGARAIGVATAAYSVEELLAVGAAAAFADLSDTGAVLEAILGR